MAVVITGSTITAPAGAIDAADLTGDLDASLLTGTLPAIDGSALTGVGASTTAGDVGTYAFLSEYATDRPTLNAGDTLAGSGLRWTFIGNAYSTSLSTATPSGTWQIMGGYSPASSVNDYPASVWVRIS